MTRLKQAWLALCGLLEPKIVLSDSTVVVTVYSVLSCGFAIPRHFTTCQQAHREFPGWEVRATKSLFIDGVYYLMPYGLREIDVHPKPKIAKGKRLNGE